MDFQEKNENTKEIQNLDELREKALDTLELENDIIKEMDENMEAAEETFEAVVPEKTEEKLEMEPKKKRTLKEKMHALKERWHNLPKKKKILIIFVTILILVLIGTGIFFLVKNMKKETVNPSVPDVIVNKENYRYQNGELIFLDDEKKEIGKYTCKNQDQNLCYLANYSDEDTFDEPKLVYEDGKKVPTASNLFFDKYAFIYDNKEEENGLVLLHDFVSSKDIETYQLVKGYEKLENKVVVKDKMGQYSFLQMSEAEVKNALDSTYDYIGVMEYGKSDLNRFVVKRNSKWYLMDFENKTLSKAINHEIRDFNDKAIKVIDADGKYHLVDYNDAEINSGNYNYIDFVDQYVYFIDNNNLMIRDFENHKMNQEPIRLENQTYVKTTTYSKENKLLKTEVSYETEVVGNSLTLQIYKDGVKSPKVINLNEGRVSKSIANLDYFDGKLYLYSDQAKTKLVGTYPCTNKNVMNDDTTKLENCTIASESFYQDNDVEINNTASLGTIPIYNERFGFFYDNPSLTNENDKTIIFYDLKDNALKSKYSSVDANAYTKSSNVVFESENDVNVIAVNKNGKYGIIKLGYNSVSGLVDFSYDHLERINGNYIAQNSSGYFLMDSKGVALAKTYTSKIRNYNKKYVTVLNNNKYYIYDNDGKQMSPSSFDYITLYDEFYGAVNNKKLNFYSYDNPEKAVLTEGVALNLTHYYGEGTLAYIATFDGTSVTIKIGKSDNKYETITKSLIPEDIPTGGTDGEE